MGLLDDTAIFYTVVQQGGFARAARFLGLSNGLISRRIADLESEMGVTLIKRTTRQLHLTPEGEVLYQHAHRIQKELDNAQVLIRAFNTTPTGTLRVSAPPYFGRCYLTPILVEFMKKYPEIKVNLILSNQKMDLIKNELDLSIRGAGYIESFQLQDSTLQMKLLLKEKIGLYASPEYLSSHGTPQSLANLGERILIAHGVNNSLEDTEEWNYSYKGKQNSIRFSPRFKCNDIESALTLCKSGLGIGRFTDLNVQYALQEKCLVPILTQYDWGHYGLYAIYPQQPVLPKRSRLLLDFIEEQIKNANYSIT